MYVMEDGLIIRTGISFEQANLEKELVLPKKKRFTIHFLIFFFIIIVLCFGCDLFISLYCVSSLAEQILEKNKRNTNY